MKAAFVVATSAGEVGVDLDADHMVSDLVAWERMVQRLGRVNRRGDGASTVIVVPADPDEKTREALERHAKIEASKRGATDENGDSEDDKGEGLGETNEIEDGDEKQLKPAQRQLLRRHALTQASLRALRALPEQHGIRDASPGAITALRKGEPELIRTASTPAPLHPPLTRALVESWSMTSLRDHTGRPEVAPWVRGWVDDGPQTAIVWRRQLPARRDGTVRKREVVSFFEAAPPHISEVLEAETSRVLDWLLARIEAVARAARDEGNDDGLAAVVEPIDPHAPTEEALETNKEVEASPDPEPLDRDDVVAMVLGGSGELVCAYRVRELQRIDKKDLRRELYGSTLVVDVRLGGLSDGLMDKTSDRASDVGDLTRRGSWCGTLPFRVEVTSDAARSPIEGWREELRFVLEIDADGTAAEWLVVYTDPRQQANTEDARSTGRAQLLAEHQEWAERRARELASRIGLPPAHASLLALAARLHDEGKQSRRWQRAFKAPAGPAWGKTISRPNVALLDGYRHELGSIPHAERDARVAELEPTCRDLLLHLIAAHHGWARPLIPTSGCDDAPPTALVSRAREIALRFARLEKQWGPWGLAWWESLLRAADQQASRDNDEQGGQRG